jgi:tetratricopeptide (TPR) repeat protein
MRIDPIIILVIIFLTISCGTGTDQRKVNGDDKQLLDQATTIDTSALRLTAHLLYQRNQYEEAIDEYNKLIRYDSLNGQFNFRIGYCLAQLGRDSASVKYYKRSADLKHREYDSYYALGLIYSIGTLSDKKKAIYYLNKCLEINPKAKDVKGLLGRLTEEKGKSI